MDRPSPTCGRGPAVTDATNTPSAAGRIFCAIVTADFDAALRLAKELAGAVGGVKLGKEFFTAHGPEGVARVATTGHRVFLDLKFHDIPNTVAGAVLTVHAASGGAMLRAAMAATDEAGERQSVILAVTVLTSLEDEDLFEVGQAGPMSGHVSRLGALAGLCGVDGLVVPPLEVAALRHELGADMTLVLPGGRPRWSSAEAMAAGADYLVIGRPITCADDPKAAARRIAEDMAKADRPAG